MATKSTTSVLGIAQIFGAAVSICATCPSDPAARKSGQDIAVLPGWGEHRILLVGQFSDAIVAIIYIPTSMQYTSECLWHTGKLLFFNQMPY